MKQVAKWITKAEELYNARYVGLYDLPDREGPIYVFYTENPDTKKGHDNYFGMFWHGPRSEGRLYITSAASIRDAVFPAHHIVEDKYLVSRYRHDYQTFGDKMIDGGLAYTRSSLPGPDYEMRVIDGHEVFRKKQLTK